MPGKRNIITIICLLYLLSSSCQDTYLDKNEAVKSLENLENEIILLTSEIRESDFVQLIKYDQSINSSPLSRIKKYMSIFHGMSIHKGVYVFNPHSASLKRVNKADNIQLNFNTHDSCNYSLLISDYQTKDLTMKPQFPLHFKIDLLKDGTSTSTLNYKAITNDHFPTSMIFNLKSTPYISLIEIKYKHRIKKGRLTLYSELRNQSGIVGEGKFTIHLKFVKSGYSIQDIHFKIQLFNVLFYGDIEYGKINPGSKNYVQEFNRHCKMFLASASQNKIIGKVLLMPLPGKRDQDFYIQYSDQSSEPIRNYNN